MPELAAVSRAESLCFVQTPTQFGKPQGYTLTSPVEASGLFLKPLSLFTRNYMNYQSLKWLHPQQRHMNKHTLQLFIPPFFTEYELILQLTQAKE